MPFKSEKQRRYMWANKPEIAKRWSEEEKKKKQVEPKKAEKFSKLSKHLK